MAKYLTPAVTPICNDKIDYNSLKKLYDHLICGGVDGILVLGSIGEFFSFSFEEKKELIKFAHEYINGRTELIVGTTSMVIDEIIELSNYALSLGVKSVMIIPPYYFHYTKESIFSYYSNLARKINGDIYLYNFPDRTGYEIEVETIKKLVQAHKNIIGIKDTISGVTHTKEIIKQVKKINPNFIVYSGFDDNFVANVMCGGDGCIAGLSNLYPKLTSSWVKAVNNNDFSKASLIQRKIDKLMDIYSVGKPFVPYIKQCLKIKGIINSSEAKHPMPVTNKEEIGKLIAIMKEYENE